MTPTPETDDGLLTIQQYADLYDTSIAYIYILLQKGELVGVKDGRRTKITRASARARAARLAPYKSTAKAVA